MRHAIQPDRPCTCLGSCRGAEGLGERFYCALKGPFSLFFELGDVPCDEPPGWMEYEYRRWKEAGGQVRQQQPGEIDL